MHAILRLAVHELLFQQLPAYVISEHVNLTKSLVRPAAGSLVNGELLHAMHEIAACVVSEHVNLSLKPLVRPSAGSFVDGQPCTL